MRGCSALWYLVPLVGRAAALETAHLFDAQFEGAVKRSAPKSEQRVANATSIGSRQASLYGGSLQWGTGPNDSANVEIPALSLREVLAMYDMPACIDMVDMDIQRYEYQLLADHNTLDLLTRRVKLVHIGLHGHVSSDLKIIESFEAAGWEKTFYFQKTVGKRYERSLHSSPLEYGPIEFGDGVLSFKNQNPLGGCVNPTQPGK